MIADPNLPDVVFQTNDNLLNGHGMPFQPRREPQIVAPLAASADINGAHRDCWKSIVKKV